MIIDWVVDDAGRMIGPAIHDALLCEFIMKEQQELWIAARTSERLRKIMLFEIHLLMLNIWEGNIISDIFVWPVFQVPSIELHEDGGAWQVLLNKRVPPSNLPAYVSTLIARHPAALLVQVEFSYGGDIVALCNGINVF